jgi:hypothetical protein
MDAAKPGNGDQELARPKKKNRYLVLDFHSDSVLCSDSYFVVVACHLQSRGWTIYNQRQHPRHFASAARTCTANGRNS